MRRSPSLASLGLGIATLLSGSGTVHAQFGNCDITTTSVAFGMYDVFASAPRDSTGSIHISCNGNVKAGTKVWLSKGNGPSTMERQMVSWHPTLGPSQLGYNLYLDATHQQVWGDPEPNCYTLEEAVHKLELDLVIYGRIAPQQDVPVGVYSDTIVVSLNF